MSKNKITNIQYKVLITIFNLKKFSCYANSEGVYKILKGINDKDTSSFINLQTFSTYVSINKQKVNNAIRKLFEFQLIYAIFDESKRCPYLTLSDEGIKLVKAYINTHPKGFRKTIKTKIPSIVYIKN